MTIRKLRFPLNQPVRQYLSSEQYNSSVSEAFGLLDLIYTYFFRYPWLLDNIEGAMSSHGSAVDFIASNPIASVGLTMVLGATAAATIIKEYRTQAETTQKRAGDYQASYQKIQERLQLVANPRESTLEGEPSPIADSANRERKVQNLNKHLAVLLQNDEALKKKYKEIILTDHNQVEFVLNEESDADKPRFWTKVKNKAVSVVSASWITLGLCSVAYWILWIGVGVLTGHFSSFGIGELGGMGFAVPLAVGALYPLIKIRNWYRNHYSQEKEKNGTVQIERDPRLNLAAISEVSVLLKKAILADEKERLQTELSDKGISSEVFKAPVGYISGDRRLPALGRDKWNKALAIGVSTTIGTFIGAEYGAWLITDFLKAAGFALNMAGVSMGIGLVLMVCSGLYGIYKAVKTYKEVEKNKAIIEAFTGKQEKQVIGLENNYKFQVKRIEALQAEVSRLANGRPDDLRWLAKQREQISLATLVDLNAHSEYKSNDKWARTKKISSRVLAFVGGVTTGITLARIATIAGTVAFLPFTAAILSNPATIGVLVVAGLAYGLFKVYQHHKTQKEMLAKALLEQRAEKIDLLKNQSEVAELQIKLLTAKKVELEQPQQNKVNKTRDDWYVQNNDVPRVSQLQGSVFNKPQPPVAPVARQRGALLGRHSF